MSTANIPVTACPPTDLPKPQAEAGLACAALAHALDRHGYAELCTSLSPLRSSDPELSLAFARGQLPNDLEVLAQVFLFGESVHLDRLVPLIGEHTLEQLRSAGFMQLGDDGAIRTAGLIVRQVLGLWYIHERPGPAPQLYYGDDSFALLWRQQVRGVGRCLDLCSGPGLQLLHAVRQGATGVGVEINRFAFALARANAAMNGLEHRAHFLHGSLFEPLAVGERFDHVLANPPLLPIPDETPYPFVGDGGDDGFSITREILLGLPDVLTPTGCAQIIATGLSDGIELGAESSLRSWASAAGLDVVVTVTAQVPHAPGTAAFEGLARSSAGYANQPQDTRAEMSRHLRRHGATHLAGLFIRAQLGRGDVVVNDVSTKKSESLFFR